MIRRMAGCVIVGSIPLLVYLTYLLEGVDGLLVLAIFATMLALIGAIAIRLATNP